MTVFRRAGTFALVITGCLLAGLSANSFAQNVYKMTDESGHIEYTDRPWEFGEEYKAELVTGIEIDWSNQDEVQAMIDKQNERRAQDE
ncbi:MAG: DUF4124 domain-containing protein, partial [Gammaproteobacteria bacterium]|nr:DUF4124 domain-containing protein [Gammaproteobacteria bacterium]